MASDTRRGPKRLLNFAIALRTGGFLYFNEPNLKTHSFPVLKGIFGNLVF